MSNPTWPVYTFRVNLQTVDRYTWLQPNRTTTDGNETVSEADYMKNTRSTWLANLAPGCNFIADKDGYTFTAYGEQATYLKKTYATGAIDDVLQIVT